MRVTDRVEPDGLAGPARILHPDADRAVHPPHNPNYEYDIYIKWAFYQAEAMEAELLLQTGLPAQIPYRDAEQGWDDWAPIFPHVRDVPRSLRLYPGNPLPGRGGV